MRKVHYDGKLNRFRCGRYTRHIVPLSLIFFKTARKLLFMNPSLSVRAREIEAFIEDHMVDDNGTVYTFVDRTTGRPITNDVVEEYDPIKLDTGSTEGWFKYENNTMVTAAYLKALLYRYEHEHDLFALSRARRCFKALYYIYERGKELEEGFMPKLYDDLFTLETSSDQVLYAILALDHYHQHATDTEKPLIARMITEMTRFWVKRDYKYTYFQMKDMQWPLGRFTFNNLAAYKHSGEEYFKNEYDRLLELGVNKFPSEEQIRPKLAGETEPTRLEKEEGGWLITHPCACASMDLSELDFLLENDRDNAWANRWKRSVIQMWGEGAASITEHGWEHAAFIIDFETHAMRTLDSRFPPRGDTEGTHAENVGAPDLDQWAFYPFVSYLHSTPCSFSAIYARAGIAASRHFDREISILPLARRIIKSFDVHNLTYYDDFDTLGEQFGYRTNLIAGDAVTHWLWGYWQGRDLGVFGRDE